MTAVRAMAADPAADRAARRHALALEAENAALKAENATLKAALTSARSLLPPQPPKGWLNVKRAAEMAGCSAPSIYKRARLGKIVCARVRGNLWIDPASLLHV